MTQELESRAESRRTPLRQALGRRIGQSRKRKGWTQAALAERLEVSQERLKKWERGLYLPSLEDVAKLSEALGMTLEELIVGAAAVTAQIPEQQRSEAASCLNAFLRVIRPWLRPPVGSEALGPAILPAQRNDAALCLNAFLRVIRPWLEPPSRQEEKTE